MSSKLIDNCRCGSEAGAQVHVIHLHGAPQCEAYRQMLLQLFCCFTPKILARFLASRPGDARFVPLGRLPYTKSSSGDWKPSSHTIGAREFLEYRLMT